MADRSAIEWCDSTFNPWIGCTKISPACDHCYAAVSTPARALGVTWGAGQTRRRTSDANWNQPLRWDRMDAIKLRAWDGFKAEYPGLTDVELEAKGFIKPNRRRVFCASLADVFDNEVDPTWRRDMFELIRATPNLDWLLLTKRIGNAFALIEQQKERARYESEYRFFLDWLDGEPPANVWLGATICNQAEADRDIPKLLGAPARVRWLSCEPLLGPVDLTRIASKSCDYGNGVCVVNSLLNAVVVTLPEGTHQDIGYVGGLNWVVAGGESGPHARPMHPDWVRSLRDQCGGAGVPFFFKQWGEWRPPLEGEQYDTSNGRAQRIPCFIVDRATGCVRCFENEAFEAGKVMRRVGKKAAGSLLDGVEHKAYPEIHHG